MKNLGIKRKIYIGLSSIVVVLLAGAFANYSSMEVVRKDFNLMSQRTTPALVTAGQVLTLALQVDRSAAQYAARPAPDVMESLASRTTEAVVAVRAAHSSLAEFTSGQTELEALVNALDPQLSRIEGLVPELLDVANAAGALERDVIARTPDFERTGNDVRTALELSIEEAQGELQAVRKLHKLRTSVIEGSDALNQLLTQGRIEDAAPVEDTYAAHSADAAMLMSELEDADIIDPIEFQDLNDNVELFWEQLTEEGQLFAQLKAQLAAEQRTETVMSDLRDTVDTIMSSVDQLVAIARTQSESLEAESAAAIDKSNMLQIGLNVLLFLVIGVGGMILVRNVLRGIDLAGSVADAIASGKLDNDIEVASDDEMGRLLGSLDIMQQNLRERIEADQAAAAENGRVRQALDNVSANVMVADAELNIIYMNDTVRQMFRTAEDDIRKDLPAFDTESLMGSSIDDFHQNPSHQRDILAELTTTFESRLSLGGRTFQITANPVVVGDGERVGTVVEWQDLTERLAREEEERQRVEAERVVANENGRIRQALDGVTGNVMIGDTDLNIIYMNDAAVELFKDIESDVRADLPNFEADKLMGSCIDLFHKNPEHQRGLLGSLTNTHTAELKLGSRTMRVIASPVFGADGERLGTVVEWTDRTQELAIEAEVQNVVDSALAGDLTNRISLDDKEGFFERLSGGVNELVGVADKVINDTARVLSAMATGNLNETIEENYAGSFGQLKNDANATVARLTEVVGNIQRSSDSVKTGAEEISQGNTDLSQRTEEQASSLEETASSMEEMTSTVKQNAENASEANQLALAAREHAEKGGSVVRQAVQAMNEIDASSRKISDIIGVIDEIAFQTNLLALNASVEAARAGDQGRGFAVVASEVRNLAGRSATAAKEIKDLIEDSGAKVGEGSRLVNESGETLEEIVSGVKKVTDIVGEIAAASQEQSAGIEEVNKAVMQLDELTQQNAALVEEASAASESMGDQADELNRMMSFFTIGDDDADRVEEAFDGEERRSAERPWTAPAEQQQPQQLAVANGGDQEWEEF